MSTECLFQNVEKRQVHVPVHHTQLFCFANHVFELLHFTAQYLHFCNKKLKSTSHIVSFFKIAGQTIFKDADVLFSNQCLKHRVELCMLGINKQEISTEENWKNSEKNWNN